MIFIIDILGNYVLISILGLHVQMLISTDNAILPHGKQKLRAFLKIP